MVIGRLLIAAILVGNLVRAAHGRSTPWTARRSRKEVVQVSVPATPESNINQGRLGADAKEVGPTLVRAAAVIAAFLAAGVGSASPSKGYKIYLLPKNLGNPYFDASSKGAQKAAKELA